MTKLTGTRRDLCAVSYALCSAVVGVIFMRLVVYFAPMSSATYGASLAADAVFSIPTQLLFFLIIPFCVYSIYGEKSIPQLLEFSSAPRKFSPWWLLALPLGFCVWIVTLGVSSGWLTFLDLLGYNYSSSEPPMPAAFNAGYFVAEIAMTAILPAVCEEFVMRGGTVTVMKNRLGTVGCVIFGGLAFGLFHQNVRQVFYTSLFGALATFLTIQLKSIYPAMIMHFTNNFCSVFFGYADEYGWAVGGGLFDGINALARVGFFVFFIALVAVAAVGAALVYAMLQTSKGKVRKKPRYALPCVPAVQSEPPQAPAADNAQVSGESEVAESAQTATEAVESERTAAETEVAENISTSYETDVTSSDNETIENVSTDETELVENVPENTPAAVGTEAVDSTPTVSTQVKEKTAPRDIMILVALAVVTTLTTLSTFIWGFFV